MKKTIALFAFTLLMISEVYSQNETFHDVASLKYRTFVETLSDLSIVIFVDLDCPYDQNYVGRIKKLNDEFKQVAFTLVSTSSDDSVNARAFVVKNKIKGAYLIDSQGKLKDELGARKSTESFLVSKKSAAYEVLYQGAIDSNPLQEDQVRQSYLRDAIQAAVSGESVQKMTQLLRAATSGEVAKHRVP